MAARGSPRRCSSTRRSGGAGGADSARPAAPAAQPRGDHGRRADGAASAAGRLLRHRVSPDAADRRAGASPCRAATPTKACGATAFTACPTSTSPRCCRSSIAARPHGRTVVAHLGNGASMCAMSGGRSVATTMGFTALDGLVMGTRCGAIDPGVLLYLIDHHGMNVGAPGAAALRAVGTARRLGCLQRHARAACRAPIRGPPRRSICSSTASAASSARSPRRSAASTPSSSPAASARTRRDPRARLSRRELARARARRSGQRSGRSLHQPRPAAACRPG